MAKALLAASIVVMGGFIVWAGSGGVGPFLASVASGFGGLVETVGTAVGSSPPTAAPMTSDAPAITAPEQPYTNAEAIDVTVTVPAAVAGRTGYTVQLYVTLPDMAPTILAEVPVGATSVLVIRQVALAKGPNDLQASIVGPGGESELSAVVSWVRDNVKPKVSVTSPKSGASIKKTSTAVKGKTQALSTVRLNNSVNAATTTVAADEDGLWQANIALGEGLNTITITITDPAGNANTGTLEVRHGSGVLRADLTGSAYRFKASKLPTRVTFTVVVTDPGGRRLAGATALFAVTVPGLEPIVSNQLRTNGSGTATFTTNIPKGVDKGSGLAVVEVTTKGFGKITDRQVLTVE